jgi:hypothetical protein
MLLTSPACAASQPMDRRMSAPMAAVAPPTPTRASSHQPGDQRCEGRSQQQSEHDRCHGQRHRQGDRHHEAGQTDAHEDAPADLRYPIDPGRHERRQWLGRIGLDDGDGCARDRKAGGHERDRREQADDPPELGPDGDGYQDEGGIDAHRVAVDGWSHEGAHQG